MALLALVLLAGSSQGDDRQGGLLAFGSCLRQWQPQPVWRAVSALEPDAVILMGDNVYTDRGDYARQQEPARIAQAYRDLAQTTEWRAFVHDSALHDRQILATWDDHDYGVNDGGGDYPHKLAAKRAFLSFFQLEGTATGNADQPGVYRSERLSIDGLNIQVLLLDTRSFRSPLKKATVDTTCPHTRIVANTDREATLLGPEQWRWMENELRKPADLRLIVSSIQVLPTQHCYEKWANFPRERQRLFDLIKDTGATGVVLLSGDRHLGEISVLTSDAIGYPLYEVTASGLNSAMGPVDSPEPNALRASGTTVRVNHFGTLAIGGSDATLIRLQIRSEQGKLLEEISIPLATLTPSSAVH
ncbi:MAG: phosphodiesterase [Porticoccaceae bacterium]|nr:phosphodiesterase [Porticoccaceae bacterium]